MACWSRRSESRVSKSAPVGCILPPIRQPLSVPFSLQDICPSFWNNDSYWAPDALTALAPACLPNYDPGSDPERWNTFLAYLHGLVGELVDLYQVMKKRQASKHIIQQEIEHLSRSLFFSFSRSFSLSFRSVLFRLDSLMSFGSIATTRLR
jgi:hypothetical protein